MKLNSLGSSRAAATSRFRPPPYPARLDRSKALLVLGAAALTIFLFALTPVTTRVATFQLDGASVGMFRTLGAGILAAPILLFARLKPPADRRGWMLLALSAFGGFIGFPVLFSMGAQRTSACHAGLIMAAIPLFTGLIGSVAKRQWPGPFWLIGAAIAMAGEAVLIYSAGAGAAAGSANTPFGDLLVLGSCLCVAGGFVAGTLLTEKIKNAFAATLWAILLATIVLLPFEVTAANRVAWAELTPQSWAALLHLTAGANIIGWAAWFWAMARGGIARVSVLQFLQPAISIGLAGAILSEQLTAPLLLAGATILAGVAIARSSRGGTARVRPADTEAPIPAPAA